MPAGRVPLRWLGAADALALALLALALGAWMFGGLRLHLGPLRLSARSETRLVVQALAVLLLRHLAAPRPPIWTREALRAFAPVVFDPREFARRHPSLAAVAPVAIASRLAVLAVGLAAVFAVGYPEAPPYRWSQHELGNLPVRWDVGWYVGIATDGYVFTGRLTEQQNINFFPAFPMAMRAVGWVFGWGAGHGAEVAWVGVALAGLAFLAALVYLHRFVGRAHGEAAAGAAVLFMATAPFALFFSVPYTEAFFLLATLGAVAHFEWREYWRAAAWGLLAGLTRPNGIILALPLALWTVARLWEWWRHGERLTPATFAAMAAAVVAPGAGLLIYSAAVWQMTGHPFYWATLQRTAWGNQFKTPLQIVEVTASKIRAVGWEAFLEAWPFEAINGVAAVIALALLVPVTLRLGLGAGLFQAAGTILPLLSLGVASIGRYTSVLYPGFVWLAVVVPARWRVPLALAMAMGQALLAVMFFTWRSMY